MAGSRKTRADADVGLDAIVARPAVSDRTLSVRKVRRSLLPLSFSICSRDDEEAAADADREEGIEQLEKPRLSVAEFNAARATAVERKIAPMVVIICVMEGKGGAKG